MNEWTKEPPTEPGWYWWRSDTEEPKVIHLRQLLGLGRNWDGGEWWPEPIQEPQ